jgi:hypothetical protein
MFENTRALWKRETEDKSLLFKVGVVVATASLAPWFLFRAIVREFRK